MRFAVLIPALASSVLAAPWSHGPPSLAPRGQPDNLRKDRPGRRDGAQHGPYSSHRGGSIDLTTNPWRPPTADAQRSPCPLLNTLANHGFLPRNGLDITMDMFEAAMIGPLNLHPEFANLLTANGFHLLGLIPDLDSRTDQPINLETLNNFTTGNEHDASLSKLDRFESFQVTAPGTLEGTIVPSDKLIGELLNDLSGPHITTKYLGLSRLRRDRESLALGSPPLREADKVAAFREAGLIIQFIGEGGDPNENGGGDEVWDQRLAHKARVAEWLHAERFPKGWRRTKHPITLNGDMLPLADRVEYWQEWWEGQANSTIGGYD